MIAHTVHIPYTTYLHIIITILYTYYAIIYNIVNNRFARVLRRGDVRHYYILKRRFILILL